MGRARLFRSDEPHMAGFGSGVVQETRYGTAAVVKIGIGWPGSIIRPPIRIEIEKHTNEPGILVYPRCKRGGMRAGGRLCNWNRVLNMADGSPPSMPMYVTVDNIYSHHPPFRHG